MKELKLLSARITSLALAPLGIILFGGGNFSFGELRRQYRYTYEVRKAHITGDWTYLHETYGTPLPEDHHGGSKP